MLSKLNDEEFLVAILAKTEDSRNMIMGADLNRLLKLAGNPTYFINEVEHFDWFRIPTIIKTLCGMIKDQENFKQLISGNSSLETSNITISNLNDNVYNPTFSTMELSYIPINKEECLKNEDAHRVINDPIALRKENNKLRSMLFLAHGSSEHYLYGDDEERSCNTCGMDFVRDSADMLKLKHQHWFLKKIAIEQAQEKAKQEEKKDV